ncbi:Apoptosis-inducing factor 2 [Podila clonocystis]|nr:Apoptosis-inducing factor 2 [Podila clonocystis]
MKHIVVVGGSYGGVACVNELQKHISKDAAVTITLIEKRDARYHCVASYRALVQPEFEKNLWIPYTNLFPLDSAHKFVRGTMTEVHGDHIVVDHEGTIHKVAFDFLVLATGSYIPAPAKLKVQSSVEGIALMDKIRTDLQNSQSIVIVGGGACGTEFAGEIKYAYPDKYVALIHDQSSLVDYPRFPQDFKDKARAYLEKQGVDVFLNERVDIEGLSRDHPCQRAHRTITLKNSHKVIESDMQFFSIGIKVDTNYMHTLQPSAAAQTKRDSVIPFDVSSVIDTKNSAIHVKRTLQLDHGDDFPNIFAIGDISNADPVPTAYAAATAGEVAARNIIVLLKREMQPASNAQDSGLTRCCKSGNESKLEDYAPVQTLMVLAMNPTGGVSNLPVVGTLFGGFAAWAVKSGDMFSGRFWKEMNMPRP